MDSRKIVELCGLSLVYDRVPVLDDVSLTVNRGDFMAVTGPNGGGKTTLLKIILKLLRPTSGEVLYFQPGSDGTLREVQSLRIGYLPQKSMIDVRFPVTVAETLRSGILRGLFSRMSDADRKAMDEVIGLCGIEGILDRTIGTLSGGQLQRTLLARALVTRPELLVLDEPLSYVDKQFEHQIYSIMEEISRKTTVILVSHEMSVISGMANRHVIVDHGLHECHAHLHYVPSGCE